MKNKEIVTLSTCMTNFLRITLSVKFETSFDNLNSLQMITVLFTT